MPERPENTSVRHTHKLHLPPPDFHFAKIITVIYFILLIHTRSCQRNRMHTFTHTRAHMHRPPHLYTGTYAQPSSPTHAYKNHSPHRHSNASFSFFLSLFLSAIKIIYKFDGIYAQTHISLWAIPRIYGPFIHNAHYVCPTYMYI